MPAAVEGRCDPRFGPLREAFRANFAERGELGAAVCVMINGHVVADLYGGWADEEQGRRWQPDTLVDVFSVINTPQWRAAESPSTNAHGTARGVAEVYAALISPAKPAVVDPAALEEAVTEQVYGQDLVLHRPSASASASSSPSPNGSSAPARRRSAISAPAVRSASPTPRAASPSAT